MWIIKNRISGEYDRKGMGSTFDKVTTSAWDTLGHAKCHVSQKLIGSNFLWYLAADFVEVTENGVGRTVPVASYLATMPKIKWWKLPPEVVKELEAYRHD